MVNRLSTWLACACVTASLSGCVERRFTVNSEPSGAKVYVNNKVVGFTPVDVPYTYYGKYLITLEYPGYQTKQVEEHLRAPWYFYPPGDFVIESLYPGKVRDLRILDYALDPMPRPNLEKLMEEADAIRVEGKNLPEPTIPVQPRREPASRPDAPRNRDILPPPQTVPPGPAGPPKLGPIP